jgi:CRISPR system Cascade subunit CasE
MSDPSLFMTRMSIDRPGMLRFGRSFGIPPELADEGYSVHALLRALFGEFAPKPFDSRPSPGRSLALLAYSRVPASQLADHAMRFADPLACVCLDLQGLASKPMPADWPPSSRLGFDVRICPVVRSGAGTARMAHGGTRQHAEVDAFLSEAWNSDASTPLDRGAVYSRWLERDFSRDGAAALVSARLISFKRTRLARRNHGDQKGWTRVERPDVAMTGILEVTGGEAFARLLARGVGRHRAFGFGMLLLKPVSTVNA